MVWPSVFQRGQSLEKVGELGLNQAPHDPRGGRHAAAEMTFWKRGSGWNLTCLPPSPTEVQVCLRVDGRLGGNHVHREHVHQSLITSDRCLVDRGRRRHRVKKVGNMEVDSQTLAGKRMPVEIRPALHAKKPRVVGR